MPVPSETSSGRKATWYSKVQTAFRPFHKLLVVLGAAIVFLTYVYKDIRTDQAKDAMASLKMAELEYGQLVDHDEVMATLRAQGRNRFEVQTEQPKPKNSKRGKKMIPAETDGWSISNEPPTKKEVWERLQSYNNATDDPDLEAVDLLRSELPDTSEIEKAKMIADAEQQNLKAMVAQIPDRISYIEGEASPPASEKEIKLLNELPEVQETAEKGVRQYIQEVVKVAQFENSNRRVRLENLSRTTKSLFVIGWLIGLLGKLFDTQEKKDEEGIFPGLGA